MRAVFGLVLVTGLGLAGTAVYMVRGHFQAQAMQLAQTQAVAAAAVPTVKVYAAARPLVYGERMTLADVQLVDHAQPFLPEGTFAEEAALFPEGAEDFRTVLRPMEPNEPILAVKVTEPGDDAGLTSRLAVGMRAFTISVDSTAGTSGFLRPGDRVDVYWSGTVQEGGRDPREVTQLIESGLGILGINEIVDDSATDIGIARTVTVEVTPQQVANLTQAQVTGSLTLSLVGHGDEVAAVAIEVDQKSLLGLEDAPEPVVVEAPEPPPPPQVCSVRTRRGADVVETPVECPEDGTPGRSALALPPVVEETPTEGSAEASIEPLASETLDEAPLTSTF